MNTRSFLLAAALAAVTVPAHADPKLLGTFTSWSAYTNGTGGNLTCYALAKPQSSEPAKAKRDPIFFLISDWPSRRTKGESQVIPGYQYKDGSTVTAQVGSDKFTFFTKTDSTGAGSAWVEKADDEQRLIDAMRGGQQVIVTGVSKRGTLTRDVYSLAGISAALDRAHQECKL